MPYYPLHEELAGLFRTARTTVTIEDEVAQLFEEARDDVYRYLMTLGLHPPQAQEAAQEVFLRLYTTLKNGEQILNHRAWVFRVAHNLGLKLRARQNALPFDPEMESRILDREQSPETSLLEKERMARVSRVIASLSEQQRRCLQLRMEGLRYPEIGEILGISASTVGEFLRRALTRLRKEEGQQ